jgi:hypothetical protein
VKNVSGFQQHLQSLGLSIPCDPELLTGTESPLRQPLVRADIRIGNRIVVHPMEGWDGLCDGNPSDQTVRRWQRFGRSGAKLIWGGEAVAVSHEGRANPNQLVAAAHTEEGLARLRATLIEEHRLTAGSDDGLLIGLQLTDSGRYSRPNAHGRPEPRILYHHPFLDRRLGLTADFPVLSDAEIEVIIESFHKAALLAWELGFDCVRLSRALAPPPRSLRSRSAFLRLTACPSIPTRRNLSTENWGLEFRSRMNTTSLTGGASASTRSTRLSRT